MIFLSFCVSLICLIGSIMGLMSNPDSGGRIVLLVWLGFGIALFIYTVYWYNKREKKGKNDDCASLDCPSPTVTTRTFDCDRDGDCDCGPDCST